MKLCHKIKLLTVIVLSIIPGILTAQSKLVTGMVFEESSNGNLPVAGVAIVERNTNNGTISDIDGKFELNVADDAVLEFRCLGYKDKNIEVNGRSQVNVQMEFGSQVLDELVFVGYGSMKKSDLVASVSSVNTDQMKSFPGTTAAEMLQGRVAGISVTASSGSPGEVPKIKIRGSRSISASNSPLYVIDGSIASANEFSMVNSNDIESIEVLKDASAQSIYGARASDGVILVTTKRGKEGKGEVSYNGYIGIQNIHRNFDFYNGDEWVALRREAVAHDRGLSSAADLPISEALNDDVMLQVYKDGNYTDWEKQMFHTAIYHNHDLSFRGGNEKVKVAASVGYMNQDGIVVTKSGYERLNGRLNVDFNVKKWLTLGVNTVFGYSKNIMENSNFYQFITRTPLGKVYDENGNYTTYINSKGDVNPLYSAQHEDHIKKSNDYKVNAFLDIKPFKGFSYRFNASYYNRNTENGRARDAFYPNGASTASLENSTTAHALIENVINYHIPIPNEKHRIDLTAVQSLDWNLTKSIGYSADNMPVDKGWNFIQNGEITDYYRDFGRNNLVSFMGRIQYSLLDRYIFNVSYRADGSSRFGLDNKWGHFPAVAAAWRITQEPFMKNVGWIDNLKLRASYGIVGNQNGIGNYTTLGVADGMPMEFEDRFQMGYCPSDILPNRNLKWEQSATANFGLDFGFFNNRLNGSLEYYMTRTTDLLVNRTLNSGLGYTSMLDNLGETRSNGVDLSLSGDVIRKKNVDFNLSMNLSHFHNRIIKIDDNVDENGNPVSQPGNNWIIGAPINIYYDYKADGIYQYDDFNVFKETDGSYSYDLKPTIDSDNDGIPDKVLSRDDAVEPGSVKISDVNGDGKINENDRVIYQKDPDLNLSLSASLKVYGFDLFIDLFSNIGGYVLNPLLYDGEYGGDLRANMNGIKVNYWTPENPSNEFPRPTFKADIPYMRSLAYQKASYLTLRTLQLGYTLPQKALSKIKCSNLRFYVTMTNLLTFTKVLSYSPEVLANAYPQTRQFVFGINLSF